MGSAKAEAPRATLEQLGKGAREAQEARGRRPLRSRRAFPPGTLTYFVLGDLDGFVHGVTEKCKGDCGFGFDVAAGNRGKHATEGGGEIRGTWILAAKQRS